LLPAVLAQDLHQLRRLHGVALRGRDLGWVQTVERAGGRWRERERGGRLCSLGSFQTDLDYPFVPSGDGDYFVLDRLAALGRRQAVIARAEADFLRAGAGDDEAAVTLHRHLDARVIDLDHQGALGRQHADHRGGQLGNAGGFRQPQPAAQE
jgi:hypothetical protein